MRSVMVTFLAIVPAGLVLVLCFLGLHPGVHRCSSLVLQAQLRPCPRRLQWRLAFLGPRGWRILLVRWSYQSFSIAHRRVVLQGFSRAPSIFSSWKWVPRLSPWPVGTARPLWVSPIWKFLFVVCIDVRMCCWLREVEKEGGKILLASSVVRE